MMLGRGVGRIGALLLVGLAAMAGCGQAPASHAKPPVSSKATSPPNVQPAPTGQDQGTGQGAQSSGPAPSGGSTGGTQTQTGPAITYALAPPGQGQGAMAQVGVSKLPSGWSLVRLEAWSAAGLMSSATVAQAMTGSFPAANGGFSMGADGQIISYFFPYPPGPYKNTSVHFTLIFSTKSGDQPVSSSTFPFPKEP